MHKHLSLISAVLLSMAAIGVPIALAMDEAQDQSYEVESRRALGYARDVMYRTDATADQVLSATAALRTSGHPPCASASVDLMRRLDMTSSYIQALGFVQDGALICSSLGNVAPIALGPVARQLSSDAIIRGGPTVGGVRPANLIVFQVGDFAAVIHRDLPIDTTVEAGVALGVLEVTSKTRVSERGFIDPNWLGRLGTLREVNFVDQGYVVAVVRSQRFRSASVAAIPVTYLNNRSSDLARRLIPAGLLAGLLAAAAIVLLARQQMSLPGALRNALKSNEFFMAYQPVVDLKTGAWVGAEALLRWRRATGELIQPDVFIPIAEQSGLIGKVSERVLQLVLSDAAGFLNANPNFHIAINLSASDFNSPQLTEQIVHCLKLRGLHPRNLIVEITERGLIDIHRAREITRRLQERGFEIAIDDFGTGYSSLAYLESLHLNYLKIDRSFIEAVGTDAPSGLVVPHIIEIAHSLSMKIIAEGVENEAQLAYLNKRGVQFAQGFFFAKPMSFNELVVALRPKEAASAA